MWQRWKREALEKEYCCLAEEWLSGLSNTLSASRSSSPKGSDFLELIVIVFNFYCNNPRNNASRPVSPYGAICSRIIMIVNPRC